MSATTSDDAPRHPKGVFDLLTQGPAQRLALYRGCCGVAIAGALLAILTALMPHEGVAGFRAGAIAAVGAGTALVSLSVLLVSGRFPAAALERLTIAGSFVYGSVFATVTYLAGPGGESTAATGLLALGLAGFLMFSNRVAVALLLFVATAYATVLASLDGVAAPAGRWTVTIGLACLGAVATRGLIGRVRATAEAEREARAEAERIGAELEVASRHKSEFLASMSHELRTPLNAVIGFSEVLGQELFGTLNDKQAEYVADVRASGQHLLTLINDVLDLAKVEAGRMDLDLGPVNLADVLRSGAALFREQAARHGITLSVHLDPDLGVVEADGRKITQVVYNLVSNAVKFTPHGGRVEVSGHRRPHAVEVAVADTGPGIAPEKHERIFEDLQLATEGQEPGTRLGLPLARRFVDLHGGRIGVQSPKGGGATVGFTLPLGSRRPGEDGLGGVPGDRRRSPAGAGPADAGLAEGRAAGLVEVLAAAGPQELHRVISTLGAAQAAVGSLLGLAAVLIAGESVPGLHPVPVALTALVGLAVSAVLVSAPRQATVRHLSGAVPVFCAAATVLVSLNVFHSGPSGGATAAQLYLGVGGGCLLGLSRRMALGQVAFIGAAYATVLAAQSGVTAPGTRWVVVLGTTAALGTMNAWVASRVRAMVEAEREARAEAERIGAELEVASRHKSEFLAGMSHELRTPLNAVIGFSEVLGQELFGTLNDKQAEYVDDIRASGQHLLTLINDVLDLAKVEAGRMDLDLGPVDLADVLKSGAALFREQAARHGITLSVHLDPDLGVVEADGRKITQVVYNLVSNAVKFTPHGGRVEVSGHRRPHAVKVAVADTGPGIAPEDHDRIFEDFQQASLPGRGRQLGTGLGLPLARRFIELHGGRIGVQSRPGAGTTVSFSLPLRSKPEWLQPTVADLGSSDI